MEKSENDYIAEFVKERYPEILDTFEYASYRLNVACCELRDCVAEGIVEVFSKAPTLMELIEERKRKINGKIDNKKTV